MMEKDKSKLIRWKQLRNWCTQRFEIQYFTDGKRSEYGCNLLPSQNRCKEIYCPRWKKLQELTRLEEDNCVRKVLIDQCMSLE